MGGTGGGSWGGFRRRVEVFATDSIDQLLVSGGVIKRECVWIGVGDEGEVTVLFGALRTL